MKGERSSKTKRAPGLAPGEWSSALRRFFPVFMLHLSARFRECVAEFSAAAPVIQAMGDSVLLAVTPATRDRLAAALAGHTLVWAPGFEEARVEMARRRFDLVVIGAHFQESDPFDVLRLAKTGAAARTVCVRGVLEGTMLGPSSVKAFRAACGVLGADAVLDLGDYADDAEGVAALRAALEHELELA
jgi:hypothetical protein